MKTVLLSCMLAGLVPAQAFAQRYDYHLLLDSTAPAARASLLASGHTDAGSQRRPDGFVQYAFTTALPDTAGQAAQADSGAPALPRLSVTFLSHGDTVTRVLIRFEGRLADSLALQRARRWFVQRLTQVYGRPVSEGEEAGWCWSARRRFIELNTDRSSDGMAMTLGIGS